MSVGSWYHNDRQWGDSRLLTDVWLAIVSAVNGFVVSPPFDIATDAWNLCMADNLISEQCINRSLQVCTADGFIVAGPGAIVLAAIYQPVRVIEQVEIRCTGSLVGNCDLLRFVVKVGEFKGVSTRKICHFQWTVLRIACHVIGADHDDTEAALKLGVGKIYKGVNDVQNIGAVIAGKYHGQWFAGVIAKADLPARQRVR